MLQKQKANVEWVLQVKVLLLNAIQNTLSLLFKKTKLLFWKRSLSYSAYETYEQIYKSYDFNLHFAQFLFYLS